MSLRALDKAYYYALRRHLCVANTAHNTLARIAVAHHLTAEQRLRVAQAHARAQEALDAALAMLDAHG